MLLAAICCIAYQFVVLLCHQHNVLAVMAPNQPGESKRLIRLAGLWQCCQAGAAAGCCCSNYGQQVIMVLHTCAAHLWQNNNISVGYGSRTARKHQLSSSNQQGGGCRCLMVFFALLPCCASAVSPSTTATWHDECASSPNARHAWQNMEPADHASSMTHLQWWQYRSPAALIQPKP